MATVGQVGELVTTQLRERVDRLLEAVANKASDFGEVTRLADAVGELTDTVAEIYTDLEQMLERGLRGGSGSDGEQQEQPQQQQQQDGGEASPADEVTKEELLERAREVNVQGRSSMTKEELADAVAAEEAVTKEELLERAREAGIEGRSSMTKDELRDALR